MKKSGKYGFVDMSGKEVIPLIYDYAEDFNNVVAKVMKAGKEYYVDMVGNEF